MKNAIIILLLFSFSLVGANQWMKEFSIGSAITDSSAIFEVNSTTKGSRPYPIMTESERDLISTPQTGLTVINSDSGKVEYFDGSAWTQLGKSEGGGGSKTYISGDNSNFESSIGDWATYDDSASSDYQDGTGGTSALSISLTTVSTEILEKTQSLKITKPASNVQYQGVSVLTSDIDRADRGKTLFAYISGDFSNATGEHWEVRAYDVTNSKVIPTSVTSRGRAISAKKGLIAVPLYPDESCTSIRLSLHVKSSNADSYSVFIDEVKLNPSGKFQIGRGFELVEAKVLSSNANSDGEITSLTYSGLEIGRKYKVQGSFRVVVNDSTSDSYAGVEVYNGTDRISRVDAGLSGGTPASGMTLPFSFEFTAEADTLTFEGTSLTSNSYIQGDGTRARSWVELYEKIPDGIISETELSQHVIYAKAYNASAYGIGNGSNYLAVFDTVAEDRHGVLDSNGGYVTTRPNEKVTVDFRTVFSAVNWTAGNYISASVFVGGVQTEYLDYKQVDRTGTQNQSIGGTATVIVPSAGTTVDVRIYQNSGGLRNMAAGPLSSRVIYKSEPDLSLVGVVPDGLEKVERFYLDTPTADAVSTSATTIRFTNKSGDQFGSYDSSTGVYTARRSGYILVSASAGDVHITSSSVNRGVWLEVYKNGSLYTFLDYFNYSTASTSPRIGLSGTTLVDVVEGDEIEITMRRSSEINSFNISSSAANNNASFVYIPDHVQRIDSGGSIPELIFNQSSTVTPTGSGYVSFTDSYVDLTEGTWRLSAKVSFGGSGGSSGYIRRDIYWSNASSSTSIPTGLISPAGGASLIQRHSNLSDDGLHSNAPTIYVRVNSGTERVYLNANVDAGTSFSTMRIYTVINAERID